MEFWERRRGQLSAGCTSRHPIPSRVRTLVTTVTCILNASARASRRRRVFLAVLRSHFQSPDLRFLCTSLPPFHILLTNMAEPVYVAIVERRVNPTHAHLGSPAVTSCQILGAFRTAEEANQCVLDQVGSGFPGLAKRAEGGGGPNSWEERDGCLRIFDME